MCLFLDLHAKLHIKDRAVGRIADAADSKFTEEMLGSFEGFKKAAKSFKALGSVLISTIEGCVKCSLRFANLHKLEDFWRRYENGEVSEFLTLRYVTQELRALEDETADLFVDVYIEQAEYSRVWDYYSSEGKFQNGISHFFHDFVFHFNLSRLTKLQTFLYRYT